MIDDAIRVSVHARTPAAQKLARGISEMRIGDYFVVALATWQTFSAAAAVSVLTPTERAAHNALHFTGYVEEGYWLRGARVDDVKKYVSVISTTGNYIFVSKNGYEILRSKYFVWWPRCFEQEGMSSIPPAATLWVDSNRPRPAEMRAYKDLLDTDFTWPPSEEIARRTPRCDPTNQLLDLAKAKFKARQKQLKNA